MKRTWLFALLPAGAALLALASCTDLGYYRQAAAGQLQLLSRRQPVEAVLADPATAPELRDRLETALRIRDFASRELKLPENGCYRCYADLERPFVVWNVVAAPELSLKPLQWCFPVAGCVSYRGYFSRQQAEAFAEGLRRQGHDVHLYGVPAYSTLGWFDDPLLNTFLGRSEPDLAGLIFHELAHQRLYVKDDSAFNEAFARAVELEGVRRWLAAQDEPRWEEYLAAEAREEDFNRLLLAARERLAALYASPLSEAQKRSGKERVFAELRADYALWQERWGGYAGFDRWLAADLNNAKLASVSTYQSLVPAFRALLRRSGGDLAAFYAAAADLGRLPAGERSARLAELGREETSLAREGEPAPAF